MSDQFDVIENPSHYCQGRKIQPIEVIEDWDLDYCLGNVIKYIARHQHKGKPAEDLKKARWYLDKAIEKLLEKQLSEVLENAVIISTSTRD